MHLPVQGYGYAKLLSGIQHKVQIYHYTIAKRKLQKQKIQSFVSHFPVLAAEFNLESLLLPKAVERHLYGNEVVYREQASYR